MKPLIEPYDPLRLPKRKQRKLEVESVCFTVLLLACLVGIGWTIYGALPLRNPLSLIYGRVMDGVSGEK